VNVPLQMRKVFLRLIEQLEQTVDGFFKLSSSSCPQVAAQIIEPIIQFKDRAIRRQGHRGYSTDALINVPQFIDT
jgi:hypothetical protein